MIKFLKKKVSDVTFFFKKSKIDKCYTLEKNTIYPESNNIPVRIKKGEFKGVVYCYGSVKIQEDPALDKGRLHFEYIPIKNNRLIVDNPTKFVQLAGDILVNIMTKEKLPIEKFISPQEEFRINDDFDNE